MWMCEVRSLPLFLCFPFSSQAPLFLFPKTILTYDMLLTAKKRTREGVNTQDAIAGKSTPSPAQKGSGEQFKVPTTKSLAKKQSIEAEAPSRQSRKSEKPKKPSPSATGSDLEESSSDLSFSEDPSTGSEIGMIIDLRLPIPHAHSFLLRYGFFFRGRYRRW
jgi:hypothetical protein